MPDKDNGAKDRVVRGVGEVGRGVREVGGGVFDAAAAGVEAAVAGVETAKEVVISRLPNDRQARDNVVMVRVDKDSLNKLDELVEAELAGSRSEAAAYLISEGIKSREPLFNAISAKVEEIRKAKEELRVLLEEQAQ